MSVAQKQSTGVGLTRRRLRLLTVVLAAACGLAVANIYYAQPILDPLARDFGVSESAATTAVTVVQIGYAVGLVLLLPLGDLLEVRWLTAGLLVVTAGALAAAGFAPGLPVFLVASAVVGLTSVVAQILIPFAAHLAPDEVRGSVVGWVGSGLLLGILLARTLSSLAAAAFGWRGIFFIAAGLVLAMAVVLARMLPSRRPDHDRGYLSLMASLVELVRHEPRLRRRATCQALVFAAFSAFWTAIGYQLIARHGFGQVGVGVFALVGAIGVIASPVAGRVADRGDRFASGVALAIAVVAMVVAHLGAASVVALGVAAVLLDLAMTGHQVLSQREIYALRPEARARINTIYMGSVFVGGAAGSALAGVLHRTGGWGGVTTVAALLTAAALLRWAVGHCTDRRSADQAPP